jgi:uncharacterized protein with PIN domain
VTKERDPLGKRALFSGAGPIAEVPVRPATEQPTHGPFDVTVHCLSCNAKTTLSAQQFIVQHFPVFAWLPVRKHSRFMRCPACNRLSWLAILR